MVISAMRVKVTFQKREVTTDQYQNHTFSTNYDDHMAVIEQALADQAAIAEQGGQAEAGTDSSE